MNPPTGVRPRLDRGQVEAELDLIIWHARPRIPPSRLDACPFLPVPLGVFSTKASTPNSGQVWQFASFIYGCLRKTSISQQLPCWLIQWLKVEGQEQLPKRCQLRLSLDNSPRPSFTLDHRRQALERFHSSTPAL